MSLKTKRNHAGRLSLCVVRATANVQIFGLVVVCLLCAGGNFAFGQCAFQDAMGHPYSIPFGPFTPQYSGPPTLRNPVTSGVGADGSKLPLKIVTFGDSAMWGNGDKPEHKIAYLVGQSVANETQRTVLVDAFAHSAARLKRVDPDKGQLLPLDPVTNQPLSDLDAERPTTVEQADCAAVNDSDAEIVLLDGCINEVGATNIALPIFPFLNNTSPAQIQERVYADCGEPMKVALNHVKKSFPHATIVVLNYWLVVSSKSSPVGVKNAVKQQMKLEKTEGGRELTPESVESRKQKWWDNSERFLNTSQACFIWAIACANGSIQGALCELPEATDDPTHPQECPSAPAAPTGSARVFLATVPGDDRPEYAYGGKEKHIWSVPFHFLFWSREDEMYGPRVKLCKQFALPGDTDCKVNPTAHPNVKGASFYAFGSLNPPVPGGPKPTSSSIMGILESAWSLEQTPVVQQH